jgi:chaperonin GroES
MEEFNLLKHQMVGDNILIEALDIPVKDGELYDPAQYEDKAEWGKVLAVGRGRVLENGTLVAPEVEVGDTITFGKYSAYKTRLDGKDYLLIRSDDVMSKYSK